jgi:hypothetical protein
MAAAWTSVLSPEGSAGSGRPAASVRALALVNNTAPSAAEGLAKLTQRRASAQVKVDQLEAEQRAASTAQEAARVALIQAEREGASSAQRAKLERALDEAEARAGARWPEKIEGARQALRDSDQQVRRYATEHIAELVDGLERDGQIAAERVNATAEAFLHATRERARAEQNLVSTVALTR